MEVIRRGEKMEVSTKGGGAQWSRVKDYGCLDDGWGGNIHMRSMSLFP